MLKLPLSLLVVALLLTNLIVSTEAELYHLCYTVRSNASSPFHPWSVAIQGVFNTTGAPFIPSPTRVSIAQGGNRTARLAAHFVGTRTQIDQFGVTTTVDVTTCDPDRSQLGSDQYLYESSPFIDYHGICFTVTNMSMAHYVTLSNNQPTDYMLLFTNLPRSTYTREYLSDSPVEPQTSLTLYNESMPVPQCNVPPVTDPKPQVHQWQFCYQSYASNWQVAISGTITTLATANNATSDNPSWRIVSITGNRAQNVSGTTTYQQIAGLGYSNAVESPASVLSTDNMLFAQAPHITARGIGLVSASVFAFPNNVIPSQTPMQIPVIQLSSTSGQAFEANGPRPTWSQFAVSRLSQGYACPMVTSSNSSSVAPDSTLQPADPPGPTNRASMLFSSPICTAMLFVFAFLFL